MASKATKLLVVDDERMIRDTLKEILEFEGYAVTTAGDGAEGLAAIKKDEFQVVLCDIKMPKMDGLELLQEAQRLKPDLPFIMVSAHGTIDTAVEATKLGAFDFIQKPPDLNRLLVSIRNAMNQATLKQETKELRNKLEGDLEIVGESPAMKQLKATIQRVGSTDARVLVTGPNGSGKELVARNLHALSPRANKALVIVNCAAIPNELIESELFGHEKGSFTSAVRQHIGKFEQADGGTLFLDEIGDMSASAQAKVLRALQDNEITRVGGNEAIKVNVRVISATNKDLKAEIASGRFREDLYHRLNVIPLYVPPLAERKEDIPLLVEKFLGQIASNMGVPTPSMRKDALAYLVTLGWTGNIRELHNVVERLVILCGKQITLDEVKQFAR